MKKIIKTMLTIIMVIVLMSTLLLAHAAPVDTVFDEFFKGNKRVDEFADALRANSMMTVGDVERLISKDPTNKKLVEDLDIIGYDMSTYIEMSKVGYNDHEVIFGDMRALSKSQIEENLKTFDFGKFIKSMPMSHIVRTNADSKGEYTSAAKNINRLGFSYMVTSDKDNIPMTYDEIEDIISSKLGNVDISYFTFLSLISGCTELYFESDKGEFFIPVIEGQFAPVQKSEIYSQYEYLVISLDDYYAEANTDYNPFGDSSKVNTPLSGTGSNNNSGFDGYTATLVTIGFGIFVLAVLVLVGKVKRREIKK